MLQAVKHKSMVKRKQRMNTLLPGFGIIDSVPARLRNRKRANISFENPVAKRKLLSEVKSP
jgi:hypothetical protein